MNSLFLDNYNLSKFEILQSLLISEYGLRHWAQSTKKNQCKWGHRMIAVIELCPLVGLIATIIERLLVSCIRSNDHQGPSLTNKQARYPKKPSQASLIKSGPWLFKGTQAGCEGPVSIVEVESIRARLDLHRPIGIQFNEKKVMDSVGGGTCSAMSLEFLDCYFKAKKISKSTADDQSKMLIDHLVKLGQKFSSSSEEMRTRQAAFNTIEIKKEGLVDKLDFSKNKVQSLANYHSFKIDYFSSEIDTKTLDSESEFAKQLEILPQGSFLIRILKPSNNEKLEECGHSLVYIKEKDLSFFYDPNYGLRNLTVSEHANVLFEGFKKCFQLFEINKATFYRLQPI